MAVVQGNALSAHVKIFVAIIVIGAVGIVGYKFALPMLRDALQTSTSDAAGTKGTLRVGVDSWVGYFPLCSGEMAKRMRAQGYVLRCEDDKADYGERFQRLKQGELELAVTTVDAYVLNGAGLDFPGAIVAVLDESKGGDAIVARKKVVANLDALKTAGAVRIAYTPASPSEHLLKSIATHFDIPALKRGGAAKRIEADGSADALKKLLGAEADVAVLWEPDVSRALGHADVVKLIGTEDTQRLIVDVLLASRKTLQDQGEAVQLLLDQYFQTLRFYNDEPERLRADVEEATGLPTAQVNAMLQGVAWATLTENGAQWFGVTPSGLPGEEGLIGAINSAVSILTAAGDFDRSPLPDQDPYRLTNRQFVSTLYLAQGGATTAAAGADPLAKAFAPLDEAGWSRLKEIGTLKVEAIGFARGTSGVDEEGQATLDRIAQKLRHYPNYRIFIKGHTGTGGDGDANLALSKQRAQAVAEYMLSRYRVDANRIRAVGYGGSRPLPRAADESDRAYGYRLPRVEVSLAAEAS